MLVHAYNNIHGTMNTEKNLNSSLKQPVFKEVVVRSF